MPRMILDDLARPAIPRATRSGWRPFNAAFFVLPCLLVGAASLRYALPGPPGAPPLPNVRLYPAVLAIHAVSAALVMIITPLQLRSGPSGGSHAVHRFLGRVSLISLYAAAATALYIAPTSAGGTVSAAGFAILGVTWLAATTIGVWHAVEGDIGRHRVWMTRSASLTFAAVTLRLYLPVLLMLGVAFSTADRIVAWLCWIPNLLVVEIWLRGGMRGRRPTVIRKFADFTAAS